MVNRRVLNRQVMNRSVLNIQVVNRHVINRHVMNRNVLNRHMMNMHVLNRTVATLVGNPPLCGVFWSALLGHYETVSRAARVEILLTTPGLL